MLQIAVECADRLGEKQSHDALLEKMFKSNMNELETGDALLRKGDAEQQNGNIVEAERAFNEAAIIFSKQDGAKREWAIARGQIADILMARGELDEALRIRVEEEIPVYERLGDVRSKAVTQGQIADILMARGELDEAIALHEQRFSVADQMGDNAMLAHIKYSIAFSNYSAQKGFVPAFIKSGHFPWKSKRKASVAVTPCFLQVVM